MHEYSRSEGSHDTEVHTSSGHAHRSLERKSRTKTQYYSYYLAAEGLTELLYFSIVMDHRKELGIKNNIDIISLIRDQQNKDDTAIINIKNSILEYKYVVETGIYKRNLFVSDIVNQLCKRVSEITSIEEHNALHEHRREERTIYELRRFYSAYKDFIIAIGQSIQTILSDLLKEKYTNDNDEILNKDDATEYCRNCIPKIRYDGEQKKVIFGEIGIVFSNQKSSYQKEWVDAVLLRFIDNSLYLEPPKNRHRYIPEGEENLNVFCLLLDRDKGCWDRGRDKYVQFMKDCDDNGVDLYISNPAFEYWLIMHFDDLFHGNKIDENRMKLNKSEPRGNIERNYAEWVLDDYLGKYNKFDLKTEVFTKNNCKPIYTAVSRANESHCKDNTVLLYELGSSVGLLIQRMMDNE